MMRGLTVSKALIVRRNCDVREFGVESVYVKKCCCLGRLKNVFQRSKIVTQNP